MVTNEQGLGNPIVAAAMGLFSAISNAKKGEAAEQQGNIDQSLSEIEALKQQIAFKYAQLAKQNSTKLIVVSVFVLTVAGGATWYVIKKKKKKQHEVARYN